jgi:hypothetical protein
VRGGQSCDSVGLQAVTSGDDRFGLPGPRPNPVPRKRNATEDVFGPAALNGRHLPDVLPQPATRTQLPLGQT